MLGADSTVRKSWRVSFPALHQGQCGDVVVGFKKAMREDGLHRQQRPLLRRQDRPRGARLPQSQRHGRSTDAPAPGLVKSVFGGKGDYQVRHPDAGEHVEAPLSKQVLVFAKGDKPFAIYPVSSGKSSTPTVTGHFSFIPPGTGLQLARHVLLVLLHGGYAVHGYESKSPTTPPATAASAPSSPTSREIYERFNYGESIFVL